MKKLLIVSLMLAVVLMAVPVMAGSFSIGGYTFNVSASSKACVSSASFGNNGSGATAWNQSGAAVSLNPGTSTIGTYAGSIGATGGYGFNFAAQSGNASASGAKLGFGF